MSVHIPEKYFSVFYSAGRAAEFPALTNVFMQGDAASDLFLITKGRVRAFTLYYDLTLTLIAKMKSIFHRTPSGYFTFRQQSDKL